MRNYSSIVKPLNAMRVGHLTNKEIIKKKKAATPWNLGPEQQTAFDCIIEKLTFPTVLAYADYIKHFVHNTDAIGDGLGAFLYQEQDGKEHVIAYASRGLRAAEQTVDITFNLVKQLLTSGHRPTRH